MKQTKTDNQTAASVPETPMEYYREKETGDFLAIDPNTLGYYRKNFGKNQYEGRAAAIANNVNSVCTTSVSFVPDGELRTSRKIRSAGTVDFTVLNPKPNKAKNMKTQQTTFKRDFEMRYGVSPDNGKPTPSEAQPDTARQSTERTPLGDAIRYGAKMEGHADKLAEALRKHLLEIDNNTGYDWQDEMRQALADWEKTQ